MKKYIATALIAAAAALGIGGTAQAASPAENTAAMNEFTTTVGVGTTVGSLVGTGIGFVVGCALGGIVTAETIVFVPVGCVTGGVAFAAAGGIIGTVIVGGPTAVIAGVKMVQVLIAPAQ